MTRRRIFWLWLPLALSFTFMMLEGPSVHAAIGRLEDPARNLAAFGLVMSLSLIIESPVIMLLSTAIALTRDTQSYRALRRFTLLLMGSLTLLTALVAWTPLYDLVVENILGIPAQISATALPSFRIMLLWTAAIGWRRFYQGILVRQAQTKWLSYGTAIRLLSTIGTAFALVRWGSLSGAEVGACALMVGVLSEALAIYLFALPVVRRSYPLEASASAQPLTLPAILHFHLPLATTSLLTLVVQPLTAAALARMAFPTLTLAAWPVVFSTLLVLRGWGLALQETTVAQASEPNALPAIQSFTWLVAGATTLATLVLSFTPLLDLHLQYVMSLEPELWAYVRLGLQLSVLLPALTALTSWLRGLIVAARRTGLIYQGMGVNLLLNVAVLILGVATGLPGVPVAAVGLLLAISAEYLFLRWRYAVLTQERVVAAIGEVAVG